MGGNDPNKPCIFPYVYQNITYTNCTWTNSDNYYGTYDDLKPLRNNKPWCPTAVDENGIYTEQGWYGAEGSCGEQHCFPIGKDHHTKQVVFWKL